MSQDGARWRSLHSAIIVLRDAVNEQQPAAKRRLPDSERLRVLGGAVPAAKLLHRPELDDHDALRRGPLPFRNLGLGTPNDVPPAVQGNGRRREFP